MAVTVALDAGHGGYDSGATYQGRREKDDNLALTLAVGEILQNAGVNVVYTRTEDVFDSPVRKAQIANESGADYFISLHRNSSPVNNQYSGVETLLYDESGVKADMAQAINEELAEVGFNNLGLNIRRDLAVLRRTQMPALLVEVGFINTDADNALLDARFEQTAQAIADGVLQTIGGEIGGNLGMPMPESQAYAVQVGLFRNPENADNLYRELVALGIPADIGRSGNFYAVRAGRTESLNEAVALQQELQQLGYDTLVVTL
ncbi:MAG: N-acetylmuramoyl-L-alanine amidase [Lachnospiraceae bacterium]|nr:N-acetylmuramoyl-L-alanine amidase [Lachnospiraceae bacterium]